MGLTLTGYGGLGEIGGNAFLLDDGRHRFLLDVGRRFGAAATRGKWDDERRRRPGFGDYFDEYLGPRAFRAVRDVLALDLAPPLPSLYRSDLGGQPGPPPVDAVLVSHAHMDHVGLAGLLRHDVPVHMSRDSVTTLASLQETGRGGWETDFVDVPLRAGVQAKGRKKRAHDDYTARWTYRDEAPPRRALVTEGQDLDGWRVEHHAVDHSIQGAGAFVLESRGHRVAYTGDFRLHGREPEKTEAFLRQAEECDVLIMEGTNVSPRKARAPKAESDVEEEIRGFIQAYEGTHGPGFVGIGYPPRDLDRFVSIHRVARDLGRRLVIQPKLAHLLSRLRATGHDLPDPRRDAHLGIYLKAREKGMVLSDRVLRGDKATLALEELDVTREQWLDLVTAELAPWERPVFGLRDEDLVDVDAENVVSPRDVAAAPQEYLFSLSYWNMTDLFDVFPDRRPGGLYVHSLTQPFNDDMELTGFKLRRWLTAFSLGDPVGEPKETHVSGHASEADLHAILERIRPKLLVPVHSEHPDRTADWYSHRIGHAAKLALPGHAIDL